MKRWSSDFPGASDAPRYPAREKRERLLADEIYLPPAPYDSHAGTARVLLVYPNTYHVGMSNLGFLYLYRLLNERPDIACERAFYEEGLSRQSLETGSDTGKFDAILFTLPFEMDALNIVRFLSENGIPPICADRRNNGRWPFVGIGGAGPSLNPRFLMPFADVVFAGDVEPVMDSLTSSLAKLRSESRENLLREMESIPGVVTAARIASSKGRIRRPEISAPRGCFNTVATPHTEFARSLLVEIERGCPFKCRFCTVGYERKKIVEMPPEKIAELVHQAETHNLRFGMVGSALLSSKIWKTRREIWDESSVDFTFASLRADKLHAGSLKSLAKFQRSLTLAPEVGTMRMMNLINKRMDLVKARERLAQARAEGIQQVKLYFIYGFPFELDSDVQGIIDFCEDAVKTGLRVKVSLNPFIPKPQTPLQWFPMQPLKILKSKFSFLRNRLRALGVREVSGYSPREAVQQATLIFSDESAAGDILSMAGLKSSHGPIADAAAAQSGAFIPKSFDQVFPWDILETSVSKQEMWREVQEIKAGVEIRADR